MRTYKGSDKGTPQGGVISPLLANIYLTTLDAAMKMARLVRYADDLVVLCSHHVYRTFDRMKAVLASLGLTLNPDKTRILNAAEEGFTFLGFTLRIRRNPRTGKTFPLIVSVKEGIRPHQKRDQGRDVQEEPRVTTRSNHCETQSARKGMGELLLLRELQQNLCTPPELHRRKGSDVSEPKISSRKEGIQKIPQLVSL